MIVKRCTRCQDTQTASLTWTSAAWVRADGVRRAYAHKLCDTCVAAKVAPVHTASESPVMTCPGCGIGTQDDYDAIWLTFIPRGVGKFRADAPFCAPCAAQYRIWFQEGARELEDRDSSASGLVAATRPTAEQTLTALGLVLPEARRDVR